MGRPRKPDVPYEEPREGEPTVHCSRCSRTWPARLFGGADHCVNCNRARKREQSNKAKNRTLHLKRRYGLTQSEFLSMVEAQGNRCAICGCELLLPSMARLPGGVRGHGAVVDHDHDTQKVRGILCSRCNQGIGYLNDDPRIAAQAARYLAEQTSDVREIGLPTPLDEPLR